MYKIGDIIVYYNTGVCSVDDIRTENFRGIDELYYILKPMFSTGSVVFCPVGNTNIVMRDITSEKDIREILSSPQNSDVWIENNHERHAHFTSVMKNCDFKDSVCMIRTLLSKKKKKTEAGKNLHASDEKFLTDATKIVCGEISYVLGISAEESEKLVNTDI